ncbi:MAG: hypothetical protein V2A61_02645 [Calditrichota bacterium]
MLTFRAILILFLAIIPHILPAASTPILIGGEGAELWDDGTTHGNGSSARGGLGVAVLDTFNVHYQPLGEGEFGDNLFPDPEFYSFQMNIPDRLPEYQSRGLSGNRWDSRGRNGDGDLPWINPDDRYYNHHYRPTGERPLFGVVREDAQWTLDYWGPDGENRLIHTCFAGTVEDFILRRDGIGTALLRLFPSVYLGYGDNGELGPGRVDYESGVYQGFDLNREPSGPLDYPAYFFQWNQDECGGSLTPCGTRVTLTDEWGWAKGYFNSIQDAIDAASDGDIALVKPGIYLEHIDFLGKNITVASLFLTTGDSAYVDSTIIDGDSSETVVFI